MTILMLDTSGPVCGVALLQDGRLIYEASTINGKTHSQKLMPMIDSALQMTDLRMEDVDIFGAVAGPGSFTGIRIGVSTAKGFGLALGKPCVAVDALEALAMNFPEYDGILCPILDARAQQVYGAAFQPGTPPVRLLQDEALKLEAFIEKLRGMDRTCMFLGDGVGPLRDRISEWMPEAVFAPAQQVSLRAGCAAVLAYTNLSNGKGAISADELLPIYLRAPQAERERLAKERLAEAQKNA